MQATDDRQQRSASAATEGTAALHELWRAVAAHPALVELSCRTKPAGYPTHARSHRPCPHSRQSDSMPQSHSNPLFAPRCHAQPNSTPSTALPRHVTPRHTTLHRTTPHHTTPHHIISHYANPPDPTKPLPTHHTPPRPAHPSPAQHDSCRAHTGRTLPGSEASERRFVELLQLPLLEAVQPNHPGRAGMPLLAPFPCGPTR